MMDLGTLRARFYCIIRPTVAGCAMLLLALVLIACLQANENLLENATGRLMLQGMSFTDFMGRLPGANGGPVSAGRKEELDLSTQRKEARSQDEERPGKKVSARQQGQNIENLAIELRPLLSTDTDVATPVESQPSVMQNADGKAASGVNSQVGAKRHDVDPTRHRGSPSDFIEDGTQKSQPPWVDEPVPYRWEQCGREGHKQGERICLYGPGAAEAKVMQPTYFYLDMLNWKDNCYARMTGPAILVVKMKYEGLYCLRGDYTAHEPGEYQLWISCKVSHANGTIRALPPNSKVYPWHHHELVLGSPFLITVLPNEYVAPRGCQPCTGPRVGSMLGQWIAKERIIAQCGEESLGAIGEWHDDDHVWVPRECTLPFFSRKEFAGRFAGADILLMGDSTVRGTFCDLQNWLHFENGPAFFSGPYEMGADGSSTWDYRSCGYNDLQPVGKNFAVVSPNPFEFGNIRIRYFEAREPETFATAQADIWEHVEANPERTYRAVLANFGLWWWHRYSPVCAPSSLIRVLLDHLRCKRDSPMPIPLEEGIDPFDCDWKTALRNLGLQVTNESLGNGMVKDVVKGRCIKPFPGRIVYRSITGKFDDHNMCTEGYKHVFDVGEVCAQKLETDRMLQESFGVVTSWDRNPLLMDVFDLVYARPDRSLDSYHFFSHKCIERPCDTLTWDYEHCCYLGNVVPWSGSMAMTNLFLHQLASDPLLLGSQLPPG